MWWWQVTQFLGLFLLKGPNFTVSHCQRWPLFAVMWTESRYAPKALKLSSCESTSRKKRHGKGQLKEHKDKPNLLPNFSGLILSRVHNDMKRSHVNEIHEGNFMYRYRTDRKLSNKTKNSSYNSEGEVWACPGSSLKWWRKTEVASFSPDWLLNCQKPYRANALKWTCQADNWQKAWGRKALPLGPALHGCVQ